MNATTLIREQARADMCRFLSACYCEPTVVFSEERLFESMVGAADILDAGLAASGRRLALSFAGDHLQDLLIDYTRLFIGTVSPLAAPYSSRWLAGDGMLMQDPSFEVLEFYQQGGFEVSEDLSDLPDHIAVEFEFLYALLFAAQMAKQSGDADGAAKLGELRQHFLNGHLERWVAPFANAVRENAEEPFYRELVDFTEQFLVLEGKAFVQSS